MAEFKEKVKEKRGGGKIEVKDNQQAWEVKKIDTFTQDEDISRIRPYTSGGKGYPGEAWNYKY